MQIQLIPYTEEGETNIKTLRTANNSQSSLGKWTFFVRRIPRAVCKILRSYPRSRMGRPTAWITNEGKMKHSVNPSTELHDLSIAFSAIKYFILHIIGSIKFYRYICSHPFLPNLLTYKKKKKNVITLYNYVRLWNFKIVFGFPSEYVSSNLNFNKAYFLVIQIFIEIWIHHLLCTIYSLVRIKVSGKVIKTEKHTEVTSITVTEFL